ncbi:uncharacterized protein STEHIDRAFT_158836 [Stereum hirsutum FP-91666 SS1]|uniref:uncharacterized protein n=1 Tax=Stereum hirsutum (strain FP-91666) TaxID=721885 RepID=UPI000444A8D2|nr:uncharacterized protein STEHIDRAFT_158836 [Stereum hirsutum FP-91666 SS1]EIM85146.1 hypothetical protein STEHIDRAFT_158836 [Stereum hirsutum FP-91666 SS1]
MLLSTFLTVVASLSAPVLSLYVRTDTSTSPACPAVANQSITVGAHTVMLVDLACSDVTADMVDIFFPPGWPFTPIAPKSTATLTDTVTVTATATASSTPTNAINVCGTVCNTLCTQSGQLPPTMNDCQVVKEAIQIFEGNSSPTSIVQPGHIQQLTFGTCRFFFENLNTVPLEFCWQDLGNNGSAAADACFPPVQPVNPSAECVAPTLSWEIGVGHA